MSEHAAVRGGYLRLLGGQGAALVAGFVLSIILVRSLGADGRGVVALLTTATLVVAAVCSSGLEGALAREQGAAGHGGEMALWWTTRLGLPLAAGWGALAAAGHELFHLPAATSALLAAAGIVGAFAANLWRGVLLGAGRYAPIASGRAASALAGVGLVLALALLDALTVTIAIAVGMGAIALQAALHWRAAGGARRPRIDAAARGRHRAYAVSATAGILFLSIQTRYDLLVVGAVLEPADVGVYAVLLSLSELMWVPVDVAALMVLGSAAGERHSLRQTFVASRLVAGLALAVAGALALLGGLVLRIFFGETFSAELDVLLLMLPGGIAFAVWRFVMSDAAGRGHPELRSSSAALGGLVALAGVAVAVPWLGLEGAAAASSLAYGVTAVDGLRRYTRLFGGSAGDLLALRPGDLRALRSARAHEPEPADQRPPG